MRRFNSGRITAWALVLLFASAQWAIAKPPQSKSKAPTIDEDAKVMFQEFSDYMREVDNFRVKFRVSINAPEAGTISSTLLLNYDVAAQRPNKFALLPKSGSRGLTVVCDGSNLYTYSPVTNQYVVEPAPSSWQGMLDYERLTVAEFAMESILFAQVLLQDNPYDFLMSGAKKCAYVYEEEEDLSAEFDEFAGPKYRRVDYEKDDRGSQLWFKEGAKPLLSRVSLDMNDFGIQIFSKSGRGHGAADDMAVTFGQWKINRQMPSRLFRFRPHAGAKQVDSFDKLMLSEDYKPLLDKQAPSLSLEQMGRDKFDLKEHKDKDVVVLCFWKTSNVFSFQKMVVLGMIAETYKDKGVVFYGVNQKDDDAKLRSMLSEAKLNLNIVKDKEGALAGLFKVRGLPHVVIIDKRGYVRVVHSGMPLDATAAFPAELDDVLARKAKSKKKRP